MYQDNQTRKNLVTIVTVTYNAEDLLEETLLSVINQTYKNIEYIIIDGGSTDNTLEIIKKYERQISYWISEPDDGLYYAMNKAIEKATGEWINFMNAGDTFADNDVVTYVMKHKDNDTELIYGNYRKKNLDIVVKAQEKSNWYQTMPFCHQTLFTRTELMKTEPFDTNFKIAADHNFILKMYQQQKNFSYLDKTLAVFSEGGFAHSNTVKMCIESLKVLMENKVDMEEIYLTSWYQYLNNADKKYANLQHKYNIDTEIAQKKLDHVYNLISDFFSTKLYKNPIEKLKACRRLYLFYKSSSK
ncbi:glycosyltransferase family 2 protein [Sulfurovum sp. CS9]|uniref:glycosyltransferase family 2 protein n=1 Tax=Sulfurovum sp. CS9 TaxID=3391146 RepID=UPI0039ECCE54